MANVSAQLSSTFEDTQFFSSFWVHFFFWQVWKCRPLGDPCAGIGETNLPMKSVLIALANTPPTEHEKRTDLPSSKCKIKKNSSTKKNKSKRKNINDHKRIFIFNIKYSRMYCLWHWVLQPCLDQMDAAAKQELMLVWNESQQSGYSPEDVETKQLWFLRTWNDHNASKFCRHRGQHLKHKPVPHKAQWCHRSRHVEAMTGLKKTFFSPPDALFLHLATDA